MRYVVARKMKTMKIHESRTSDPREYENSNEKLS